MHVAFAVPAARIGFVSSKKGAENQRDATASRRKNEPELAVPLTTSAVCHG
jgi:hypothetical protein